VPAIGSDKPKCQVTGKVFVIYFELHLHMNMLGLGGICLFLLRSEPSTKERLSYELKVSSGASSPQSSLYMLTHFSLCIGYVFILSNHELVESIEFIKLWLRSSVSQNIDRVSILSSL